MPKRGTKTVIHTDPWADFTVCNPTVFGTDFALDDHGPEFHSFAEQFRLMFHIELRFSVNVSFLGITTTSTLLLLPIIIII